MANNLPQTPYDMLVELAQTLNALQGDVAQTPELEAQRRETLKRIAVKILQENNGHVDLQVNMQGDSAGAIVLIVSVDALYVPYNLG
jgi:hypothetical protein